MGSDVRIVGPIVDKRKRLVHGALCKAMNLTRTKTAMIGKSRGEKELGIDVHHVQKLTHVGDTRFGREAIVSPHA